MAERVFASGPGKAGLTPQVSRSRRRRARSEVPPLHREQSRRSSGSRDRARISVDLNRLDLNQPAFPGELMPANIFSKSVDPALTGCYLETVPAGAVFSDSFSERSSFSTI